MLYLLRRQHGDIPKEKKPWNIMFQGPGGGRGLRFSLLLGHARGKTTLSCFLTLSRRFATRAFWANGFQFNVPCQVSYDARGLAIPSLRSLRCAQGIALLHFSLLCPRTPKLALLVLGNPGVDFASPPPSHSRRLSSAQDSTLPARCFGRFRLRKNNYSLFLLAYPL